MFSGFELGRTVFTGAPLTGLCCRPEVGCPPNGCAAAAPNGGGGGGCVPKDNPCRAAFELYHQWYDNRVLHSKPQQISAQLSPISRGVFLMGCGAGTRSALRVRAGTPRPRSGRCAAWEVATGPATTPATTPSTTP